MTIETDEYDDWETFDEFEHPPEKTLYYDSEDDDG